MTDHEKAIEAVAAKLRSPSTFPGETATAVARELIDSYIKAGGFDSVPALFDRIEEFEAEAKTARGFEITWKNHRDELLGKLADARAEALEEAAKVCTGWLDAFVGEPITTLPANEFASDAVRDIRDAIRALKSGGTNG